MTAPGESDDVVEAKELATQAAGIEESEQRLRAMRDQAAANHANARVQELTETIARLRGQALRLREQIKRMFD